MRLGKTRGNQTKLVKAPTKPKLLDILRLLPKTNCMACGEPTCMVFADRVVEGAKGPEDCQPLEESKALKLQEYLKSFFRDY